MTRIIAKTLDEAYLKAVEELGCSITELEIEVLQSPSSGFLGMFSKDAIISATKKGSYANEIPENFHKISKDIEPKTPTNISSTKKEEKIPEKQNECNGECDEIKNSIKKLISESCFNIELTDIYIKDEIVNIKLDGEDSALLIGKEGYRYKAFSYLLHNWIKIKYKKNIILEISEFLKNQKAMIDNYLVEIKRRVEENGKAQTKPLDGILVKLALENLREAYPNKYVAIKTIKDNRKIIVVNEFKKEPK